MSEVMGPPDIRKMTGAEWSDHIVHRDAIDAGTEYTRNALNRAAEIIEKHAMAMPEGYYRHWNRVDAQVLRNLAGDLTRQIAASRGS